jgi:hypothetical protein
MKKVTEAQLAKLLFGPYMDFLHGDVGLICNPVGEPGNRRQCHEIVDSWKFSLKVLYDLLEQKVAERHSGKTGLTIRNRIERGGVGVVFEITLRSDVENDEFGLHVVESRLGSVIVHWPEARTFDSGEDSSLATYRFDLVRETDVGEDDGRFWIVFDWCDVDRVGCGDDDRCSPPSRACELIAARTLITATLRNCGDCG